MVAQLPPISRACWERAYETMETEETGVFYFEQFVQEHPQLVTPLLQISASVCFHYCRGAIAMWLALRFQIEENQIKDLEALIRKE